MPHTELPHKTPLWVWGLMFAMALTQPMLGLSEWAFPPDGYEYTGLPIPDSVIFLRAMEIPVKGLQSAYASPDGGDGIGYFAVPHLWFYAIQGVIAKLFGIPVQAAYFIFNGLGAFFFLFVCWRLIGLLVQSGGGDCKTSGTGRCLSPKEWAFALFCLGGGLGGLALWTGLLTGFAFSPDFAPVLRRFGMYELMEGPHLAPHTLFARSYYTFSLGLTLAGLHGFIQWLRWGRKENLTSSALLILAGGLINARYGVFCAGLCLLPVLFPEPGVLHSPLGRLKGWLAPLLTAMMGFAVAEGLTSLNPAVKQNHYDAGRMAMWFMPFLAATLILWLMAGRDVIKAWSQGGQVQRTLLGGLAGFLAVYSLLYAAYQVYFGTGWQGAEGGIAAKASDWALLGAGMGMAATFWRGERNVRENNGDWVVLWTLGVIAVALAGFGRGWFLGFGPQRAQVLVWLPLCILAGRRFLVFTRNSRPLGATCVILGVLSIAASLLYVQGPWGYAQGVRVFPETRCDIIAKQDAEILKQIPHGSRLLAPLPAADIAYVKAGVNPVFGYGTFNLGNIRHLTLENETRVFFSVDCDAEMRQNILRDRRVEYVWTPIGWGYDGRISEKLREMRGVKVVAEVGGSTLFHVEQ